MSSDDVAAGGPPATRISGIWRRLGALSLDGLLLGVSGMVLGMALYDELIELGQLGRIVGLVIAVPYFALLNSRIGAGQTLGKRLLGIRVVGASGETVGPGAALLRTAILVLPWALNGIVVPNDSSVVVQAAVTLGVFGVGGSILYLVLANRHSRQSLHDLAARTWVVLADSQAPPPGTLSRVHAVVVACLLSISLLLPAFASRWAAESSSIAELIPLQASIQEAVGSSAVSVHRSTTVFKSTSGSDAIEYLKVTARLTHKVDDFAPTAREIAAIVLRSDARMEEYENLVIVVGYGFDILIASTNVSRTFSHTPAEWRREISSPD